MTGISISLTSEVTILPNAAPRITAMARSSTLPRMMNFLNSANIGPPSGKCSGTGSAGALELGHNENEYDGHDPVGRYANRRNRAGLPLPKLPCVGTFRVWIGCPRRDAA